MLPVLSTVGQQGLGGQQPAQGAPAKASPAAAVRGALAGYEAALSSGAQRWSSAFMWPCAASVHAVARSRGVVGWWVCWPR
jgi:hypothetical protein